MWTASAGGGARSTPDILFSSTEGEEHSQRLKRLTKNMTTVNTTLSRMQVATGK